MRNDPYESILEVRAIGGRSYVFPSESKKDPDLVVATFVRDVVLKGPEDVVIADLHLHFFDVAFLAKALAEYMHSDAILIDKIGGMRIFATDAFRSKLVSDLQAASQELIQAAAVIAGLPTLGMSDKDDESS